MKTKAAKKDVTKITKKSIIIDMLQNGATIEQMAKAIVKKGIGGDLDRNIATTKLWLPKIGFAIVKDEKGIYKAKGAKGASKSPKAQSPVQSPIEAPKVV